jgi:hypothetical protein
MRLRRFNSLVSINSTSNVLSMDCLLSYSTLRQLTAFGSMHCYVYLQIFKILGRSAVRPVWCTTFLIISIYRMWLSAVPRYPLFVLKDLQCTSCPPQRYIRPKYAGGYGCRILQIPSHRSRLINVASNIITITRRKLSIVWHEHFVASHGNMRRNVFGESNHC